MCIIQIFQVYKKCKKNISMVYIWFPAVFIAFFTLFCTITMTCLGEVVSVGQSLLGVSDPVLLKPLSRLCSLGQIKLFSLK